MRRLEPIREEVVERVRALIVEHPFTDARTRVFDSAPLSAAEITSAIGHGLPELVLEPRAELGSPIAHRLRASSRFGGIVALAPPIEKLRGPTGSPHHVA